MEASIAQSLFDKATERNPNGIDIGEETKISFPYLDIIASMSYADYMDPFIYGIYKVGIDIWSLQNLPSHWLAYIKDVLKQRESNGIRTPLNILSVIQRVTTNNSFVADKVKSILGDLEFDDYFLADKELIIKLVDLFFTDPELSQILKERLVIHIPYLSAYWVEMSDIVKFMKKIELNQGVVVDIGCGTGEKTLELVGENRKVLGIDRIYYKSDSEHFKLDSSKHLLFAIAEATRLPIGNHSVDLVNMTAVAGHIGVGAIMEIEREIKRILKIGGYLLVGPQDTQDYRVQYRLFKLNEEGILVELSLVDILEISS